MTLYVRFSSTAGGRLARLDAVVRVASPFDLGITVIWHAVAFHARCRVSSRCGRVPLSPFMRRLHAVAVRRGQRAVMACVCTPLHSFGDFTNIPTSPFSACRCRLCRGEFLCRLHAAVGSPFSAPSLLCEGLPLILVPLSFSTVLLIMRAVVCLPVVDGSPLHAASKICHDSLCAVCMPLHFGRGSDFLYHAVGFLWTLLRVFRFLLRLYTPLKNFAEMPRSVPSKQVVARPDRPAIAVLLHRVLVVPVMTCVSAAAHFG